MSIEKWTAEHTPGGLIIRDAHGKFIAMSYAPTTQEEKDNLEMILNAPVIAGRRKEIRKEIGGLE